MREKKRKMSSLALSLYFIFTFFILYLVHIIRDIIVIINSNTHTHLGDSYDLETTKKQLTGEIIITLTSFVIWSCICMHVRAFSFVCCKTLTELPAN